MANQNRSAGYCEQCQRGVTVVKPSGNGFFGRVRTAITNSEDTWVCSKCGNPASKGFSPPPDASALASEKTQPITEEQPVETETSVTAFAQELQPLETNNPDISASETFSVASGPEATCHLCNNSFPFTHEESNTTSNCPGCQAAIILPQAESSSLLTSSPVVIKLDDDPQRPAISKSICALCQFEMTYPKKLAGKDVDCPSCESHFQLP